MTGPVLFFLALDKGAEFAAVACVGIELGVACIAVYLLAYSLISLIAGWQLSLAMAVAGFFSAALALRHARWPAGLTQFPGLLPWTIESAAGAAALSLALAYLLLPRSRIAALEKPLPWWDIPMRMLATVALVAVILVCADLLGPELSGMVATFPAIVTVVASFTHKQWGAAAARRVLRGLARSLYSFIAFFLVVGWTLPHFGLVPAFVAGGAVAMVISAVLLVLARGRTSMAHPGSLAREDRGG
jgi:hypothetical protein